MRINIHVNRNFDARLKQQRYVEWTGEIDWPSVPPEGGWWTHCSGWSSEQIKNVFYCGPYKGIDISVTILRAPIVIELSTTEDVLDHLVEEHGFTDNRW